MKKALIIALAVFIVLLPTIAAIVLNLLPEDVIHTQINISGTLFVDNTTYEFDKNKNEFLASFFNSLEQNSSPVELSSREIEYDKVFIAEIVDRNDTSHVTLYLSLEGNCYYEDKNGALREIHGSYADKFLSSEFAISIYEELHSPALLTFSNEVVLPKRTDFKYTVKNTEVLPGKSPAISDKMVTYYSSNTSEISFSVTPDICDIVASVNGSVVYRGSLFNFDISSIPNNATVKYEIEATWIKSHSNDCFGTATYAFYVKYSPAPAFEINTTSLEAGEFLIIKATDIISSDRVSFSFSGGLDVKPRFFKNGENYYAIVPFSMDLKSGEYNLTVTCGETTKSANITITERNRVESSTVYTLDEPLTEQSLAAMNGLISSIGMNCSDKIFPQSTFINYEQGYENDFYFKLGYGRIRTFESGPAFDMIGIEFSASEGVDIPVINDGIICASGEDFVLGKYIVVDHGYGLKSWYCNISETSLSVGDEVKKGDTIAKTGRSAFYSQTGFYLITTVLDVPVSPYAIYEDNFVLPQ